MSADLGICLSASAIRDRLSAWGVEASQSTVRSSNPAQKEALFSLKEISYS